MTIAQLRVYNSTIKWPNFNQSSKLGYKIFSKGTLSNQRNENCIRKKNLIMTNEKKIIKFNLLSW